VEFVQQWATITSEVLRSATQNKRRGMLTYGVVLLHVNTLPHTAARTRALLEHLNWELFDHTHLTALISLERLPPVHLSEELVGITALQQ
jgi:hypothetical protein